MRKNKQLRESKNSSNSVAHGEHLREDSEGGVLKGLTKLQI